MEKDIKILILEDNKNDTRLIEYTLMKNGIRFVSRIDGFPDAIYVNDTESCFFVVKNLWVNL